MRVARHRVDRCLRSWREYKNRSGAPEMNENMFQVAGFEGRSCAASRGMRAKTRSAAHACSGGYSATVALMAVATIVQQLRTGRALIIWGVVVGVAQAASPLAFWWLDAPIVYAFGLIVIASVYIGFAVADGRPRVLVAESAVATADSKPRASGSSRRRATTASCAVASRSARRTGCRSRCRSLPTRSAGAERRSSNSVSSASTSSQPPGDAKSPPT